MYDVPRLRTVTRRKLKLKLQIRASIVYTLPFFILFSKSNELPTVLPQNMKEEGKNTITKMILCLMFVIGGGSCDKVIRK